MTEPSHSDPARYLVTAALPYGNGPIHIGHIAGAYLPADICVRYLRLSGRDAAFICGSDENGVAITIKAKQQGISNQELIDNSYGDAVKAFDGLGIKFDIYGRTRTEKHNQVAQEFFLRHHEQGYVQKRSTEQLYCPACDMFLPDRYVEGTCHHCQTPGAKGDQCESCGKMIDATKLVEPRCALCGGTPEVKGTDHWFLRLDSFEKDIQAYINAHPHFRDNVKRFSNNLLKQGLIARSITRDLDWGVPLPLEGVAGKVLYVWFDAPIGYITFTQEWAAAKGKPALWKQYWQEPDSRILHFIGKDNIVFHAIIWPAILMGHGDYQLPYDIVANEFLNIKGAKASTSRNYAVWVNDYLEHFSPDPLRYYLSAIAPEGSDSNFTWEDFQLRNNSELADTLGNFIQRNLVFAQKYFEGTVPEARELSTRAKAMLAEITTARVEIAALLDAHKYKAALERLMRFAQGGNQFLENEKPWTTRKTDLDRCAMAVHIGLRVVEALGVFMSPFLPFAADKLRLMLNLPALAAGDWHQESLLVAGHAIGNPEILFRKFEDDEIQPHAEQLGL
ncbi:MAG: methionine--tRNA ligase [Planctomycetes bacterium]|nr:methionine--tRNA ligase [Planctomycetota bacterium]